MSIPRLREGDRLVLATHNAGKLVEFQELFEPFGLDLTSAGDLGLRKAVAAFYPAFSSGDVRAAAVKGDISRTIMGSGSVRIGE